MERPCLLEYVDLFLRRGQEVAYVQPEGYRTVRWSYQQVAETAFRLARELESRGIQSGERVLLWAPNSAEWVTAFFGCMLRGAVVVPIDDAATADFSVRVCQQVSARLLVCSREHSGLPISTLLLENLATTLRSHSHAPYPANAIDSATPLEIVFTSGTTADPKGVVISHGNVLANVTPLESEIERYLKYERFVHPVRFLNLLPLSHVFGQFLGIFLPPLLGGTVIFQNTMKPAEIVSIIRRERVSVLVAVPRQLQALKEKIERDVEREGSRQRFEQLFQASAGKHFLRRWWIFRRIRRRLGWKFWAFIAGGAALDSETEEFWGRLGYAVVQGYGLTETTSLISVNHPFRLGKGSIGKILAGREVKLATDGEIMVRGGGVAAGYWNGQQLQPVSGQDGWYQTGDIGELDAEGNLYFKGRKKEVIVTPAGMNVYPADLEEALRRQPEIKDAIVIPLPRNGNAEACAVVILMDRGIDPEIPVKRANESLAEYQRINHWFVWREKDFPRTSTLKPRRNIIQQAVQAQMAHPSDRRDTTNPVGEMIQRITGRVPARLTAEANLESDLNLSSLDRVALLGELEERYHLDLSETGFSSVRTVGELEEILQGRPSPRASYHYPGWVQRWPVTWVRLISNYLLLRPAVLLLGWPEVVGRENLRGVAGPVLIICNHIGDVDLGFVHTALPARLRNNLATATGGEALESLRIPPQSRNLIARGCDRVRWILGVSLLNLFPLPREAGFRQSFTYAGESVDRGFSVLVFPEGHHTTDGKLLPFRAGIGLLANNLRIPIVPMRIDGLFEIKQEGRKFAWPGQVKVKIGCVIRFSVEKDPREIARELQKSVQEL